MTVLSDRWDPQRWRLAAVVRRGMDWVHAKPARRRLTWVLLALLALFGIPLLTGAIAAAQGPGGINHLSMTALDWTGVKDSNGVLLSRYNFVTADSSLFSPVRTVLLLLVWLEFLGWWMLITLSLWVIGWVISFTWLNTVSKALDGVGHALVGQLATTMVMLAAVTLGAFFVAYFVARGNYAKAVRQIVTMLAVAVFGILILADPLAHVLGPDGVLAKGRDIGVSVAAGLNGNSAPDPTRVVASMQATMADNFARKPLQVWNFGHVIDDRGSCGATWSSGIMSRDTDLIKTGLYSCRDLDAYTVVTDPDLSDVLLQMGDGLVLLLCGLILVFFAVGLSIRIIWMALDSVYHALLAVFGVAAGGYIYGPTQTFLIRNIVDSIFAGLSMAAYTIFLGIYVLVLGDLFREAGGQVFSVLVIGAVVEIVAFAQVRRLARSLDRGGSWVAGRFALATQGPALSGGGVGGGVGAGSGYALTGLHAMAILTALNTLNTNPAMAWLLGGGTTAFSPLSRGRLAVDRQNIEIARKNWLINTHRRSQAYRDVVDFGGRYRVRNMNDGYDSPAGLMLAIDSHLDVGASREQIAGSLMDQGVSRERIRAAYSTLAAENTHIHTVTTGYQPRVKAAAALKTYIARKDWDPLSSSTALGQLRVRADNFVTNTPGAVDPASLDTNFQSAVARAMTAVGREDVDLSHYITDEMWNNASADDLRAASRDVANAFRDEVMALQQRPGNLGILDRVVWHDDFARKFNDAMNPLSNNPWAGPIAGGRRGRGRRRDWDSRDGDDEWGGVDGGGGGFDPSLLPTP